MIDLSLPMSFIGSIPNVTYSSLTTISHLLEDYPVIDHEGSLNRDIKNIVYTAKIWIDRCNLNLTTWNPAHVNILVEV